MSAADPGDGYVFISHSSRDATAVQAISAALEAQGFRCWHSGRDVRPGENFQEAIVAALRGARALVVLVSQASNQSDEVKKELALASAARISVYPVRLDATALNPALTYELSTRQWIEHDSAASVADRLAAMLRAFAAGEGDPQPAPAAVPLPTLPKKPSLAVLPFANLSGDPDQAFFSDGTAEDIISQISRSSALFVIGRSSSFSFRDKAGDLRRVGRELGVRYVLQGSVRRAGGRVRVGAQLVEAQTGVEIWSDRFDRMLEDIFAVQDEISSAVARAIEPAISEAEQQRISRTPPESLGAWEAYQRALWHYTKHNQADMNHARAFLEQAIRLDPGFSAAYSELAWVNITEQNSYGSRPANEVRDEVMRVAEAALTSDPRNAEAHAAIAMMHGLLGDTPSMDFHNAQALALNPNSIRARRGRAARLLYTGQPGEAREMIQDLMRRNPFDETTATTNRQHVVISYFFEADYAAAAQAAREAIAAHPGHPQAYRWLAAALGHLGLIDEAGPALRRAIAIAPGNFDRYVRQRPVYLDPRDHENMLDGLRKAGWAAD